MTKYILFIISILFLVASGVLFYLSNPFAETGRDEYLKGVLANVDQNGICIEDATICYSEQYVKATLLNRILTIGPYEYTLAAQDQDSIFNIPQEPLEIVFYKQTESDIEVPQLPSEVLETSNQTSVCYEGIYVFFSKLSNPFSTEPFTFYQNNGYLELHPCIEGNTDIGRYQLHSINKELLNL